MSNSNDDIVLILDADDELTLVGDEDDEFLLIDDTPYAPHYPEYTGAYEVTPILNNEQVLDTDNKVMTDDVTVHPIPVVYTTNPYGGKTVLIG